MPHHSFHYVGRLSRGRLKTHETGKDRVRKDVGVRSRVSMSDCPNGAEEDSPGLAALFAANPGYAIRFKHNPEGVEVQLLQPSIPKLKRDLGRETLTAADVR